jgi:hypothetical protein
VNLFSYCVHEIKRETVTDTLQYISQKKNKEIVFAAI